MLGAAMEAFMLWPVMSLAVDAESQGQKKSMTWLREGSVKVV
jgi:hypothetical protein